MSPVKRDTLFDPACQDCAEHFLSEEPYTILHPATVAVHEARVKGLAQAIQRAVEDWCEDNPLVNP